MFLNIFLIVSSDTIDSLTLNSLIPLEVRTNDIPLDLSHKLKIESEENLKSIEPSTRKFNTCNHRPKPYKRDQHIKSNSYEDQSLMSLLLNFLKLMRTKYLKKTNSNINEDMIAFNNLIKLWEEENIISKYNYKKNKFPNLDYLKKYKSNYVTYSRWMSYLRKLLNEYLPYIKNEISLSSIEENSKRVIIENINNISRAMMYYENLTPKYLNYVYHTTTLKLHYFLIVSRFPYLFDHFNLCGNFVNLYEMIIELYISKTQESSTMKKALYQMSMYITRLMDNRVQFLLAIRNMLALFENLVPSN
ncbi:uncharacterized protein VNE69_08172 [Vairimorpha necatrix]|uniref:Uncharacterized protein n=1 Tax=Vairimorpha necatrix TaxID=6039 RepID=A0AAX4JEJ4_9MICR